MDEQAKQGCAGRKPDWIRVRAGGGAEFVKTRERIRSLKLNTVCESAQCPNIGKCWSNGRATIMILGEQCTRGCRFCGVFSKCPDAVDLDEPRRVADAVKAAGLDEVVVTSVTRDDLEDGGSAIWAETIERIKDSLEGVSVEVLIPDFCGSSSSLQRIIDAAPDVLGHNLETVPRLYPAVRPEAEYARSLELLKRASEAGCITKTSVMVGVGEELVEVEAVMADARQAGCDIFYIGQYLQPTTEHLPVARYVTPEEFAGLRRIGGKLGFAVTVAAPLVRSSYHDEEQRMYVRNRLGKKL